MSTISKKGSSCEDYVVLLTSIYYSGGARGRLNMSDTWNNDGAAITIEEGVEWHENH